MLKDKEVCSITRYVNIWKLKVWCQLDLIPQTRTEISPTTSLGSIHWRANLLWMCSWTARRNRVGFFYTLLFSTQFPEQSPPLSATTPCWLATVAIYKIRTVSNMNCIHSPIDTPLITLSNCQAILWSGKPVIPPTCSYHHTTLSRCILFNTCICFS